MQPQNNKTLLENIDLNDLKILSTNFEINLNESV